MTGRIGSGVRIVPRKQRIRCGSIFGALAEKVRLLTASMLDDIAKILFHESTILVRLDELAAEITEEYRDKELTVIAVLNGSFMFMADLLRRVPLPLRVDCLSVSSYHGGTESSGTVTFDQNTLPDIDGRHVLILDDILDSGLTLHAIVAKLRAETQPLSVRSCVLLAKRKVRAVEVQADYVGFEIGDEFVVGYGLDFQERYRNLPFVGVLRRELYATS
jgi:hypoxanthine phosphoribosyltransferase